MKIIVANLLMQRVLLSSVLIYRLLVIFPINLFTRFCEHRPDSVLAIVRRYLWSNMWDIHYDSLPRIVVIITGLSGQR